jgi:acyl carrier protein
MRQDLIALITELIREILEAEGRATPELGPDTPLYAKDGLLDSMGIVSLVIAVEQAVEDREGIPVALADEKALSQTTGPYRTIGTLAEYTDEVLKVAR